jgi:predicted dehydrogenase
MKRHNRSLSRRQFIQWSAAFSAPLVLPGRVLGLDGATPPSERIVIGSVGWGMQGPGNTMNFANQDDALVAAVCDLDKLVLQTALDRVNGHYKNTDCKGYSDYREMFERKDIDAVMLAVPDHWHAILSVEATNAGKDVFGEKPLARTIAEQQAIVRAVQRNKRIWQTGSWQRSVEKFRIAAELVRNGVLGPVTRVEVGLPAGHNEFTKKNPSKEVCPVPPELDYDRWIGPSKMTPYIPAQVHMNWRWNYNTGGGQLLDWVGHHCDIAHWGMDWDNSGPLEVKPISADFPPEDAVWNTATKYRTELKYPGGVEMVLAGGHEDIRGGTKWIGPNGWIWVNRNGLEASNEEWLKPSFREANCKVKLYASRNHFRNFLDCIKSRKPTITPVETAHHSAIPGHLSLIALKTNRTIRWDAAKEVIVGDADASKLLTRPYRAPYQLG